MSQYEHTQPGTLMRIIFGFFSLSFGSVALGMLLAGGLAEAAIGFGFTTFVLLICLAFFHSLTVWVSPDEIKIAFGIGLIQKRIPTKNIQSATSVRNRWYNGWGIKLIRHGWLYNVSGFDAVELVLEGDRRCRIGTDEPGKLLAAIESAIESGK